MAGNATLIGRLSGPCIVLHSMRAFGIHAECLPTAHWLQRNTCLCVLLLLAHWSPGDAGTYGVQQCCCQCCYGQALAAAGCVLEQVVGGSGGGRVTRHSRHEAGDCINLWRMVVGQKGWRCLMEGGMWCLSREGLAHINGCARLRWALLLPRAVSECCGPVCADAPGVVCPPCLLPF